MKITETQIVEWIDEYFKGPADQSQTRPRYEAFLCDKAAEHALARAASVCDSLRVKGGDEWSSEHMVAVQALTEASTAIRALKEGE